MFLSVYLLVLVSEIPPSSPDVGVSAVSRLVLEQAGRTLSFDWHDEEDRVRGTIEPANPRAGDDVKLAVHVGTYQGAEYVGPVTVGLRPVDQVGGAAAATITRQPGEKSWVTHLAPTQPGEHVLEIGWRTTRAKVVRAKMPVYEAKLPAWLGWAVGLTLISISIGGGVSALWRASRLPPSGGAPPNGKNP